MNAVSAEAIAATVARLHPVVVVVVAATANVPVALAGVAVTEMVGRKEMVETNAGGEAGLLRRGTLGGVCLLIGGGTIEPELLLWTMALN